MNRKEIEALARTTFGKKGISFGEWCMVNTCHKNPADEICIFVLCKIYNRHCIIYHNEGFWTTVKHKETATSTEVGNLCDIHLLHLGNRKYGECKELDDAKISGLNKFDVEQLLLKFAEKRKAKAQFVPRETRGLGKRKLLDTSHELSTPSAPKHGHHTSMRPTRDASKGVNCLELNEGHTTTL